jgi:hypothetical protein
MYQCHDWQEDFAWLLRSEVNLFEAGATGYPPGFLESYFAAKYGDRADFHRLRLCAAVAYEKKYLDHFDEPPIAISGEGRTAVGKPLIDALFRLYRQCPDHMIDEDYPPDFVLELARESAGS